MRGRVPKLFLVRAIMKVVENTVEGVMYISIVKVYSVVAVVCH